VLTAAGVLTWYFRFIGRRFLPRFALRGFEEEQV
jgi:hypothetical protein